MKKLFCVLLCLLLTSLLLVSCGDVKRDEWLGNGKDDDGKIEGGKYDGYGTVNTIPEVPLNLYIIVEDETIDSEGVVKPVNTAGKYGEITQAINTVNNAIKDYTSTNYHTPLNVIYVRASDYDTKVLEAVMAENTDAKAANIVLVNSYALMQELYATGKLCSLDSYLDTTKYGRLNTAIPTALFEASKLESVNAEGKTVENLYTIPNNHVIGHYEYLLINKELAKELKINETVALGFNSYEKAYAYISEAINNAQGFNKSVGDVVALESGAYEDRFVFEKLGYYCNVVKNPVADKNEAFLSAFAIVNRNEGSKVDVNDRAMEIIYNINTNAELRNLLQYGVAGTNYKLGEKDDVIEELLVGSYRYSMNCIYTGNIMTAYLCDEIDWTEEAMENAIRQNSDSQTIKQIKESESKGE